jgi:signal transduction histidine kinase
VTWVYPEDEAAASTRAGLTAGAFWASILFIVNGVSTLVTDAVLAGHDVPYLGLGGYAGVIALLIAGRLRPQPSIALAAVMLLAATLFAGMLGAQLTAIPDEPVFPIVAMLIATAGLGGIVDSRSGAVGTLLGYALPQAAILATASAIAPEPAPIITALVIAALYGLLDATRRRGRSSADRLDDAARADLVSSQRRAFELRSRALVHDTVLSDLVAIGMSRPGQLSPAARASIVESLAAVRGPGDPEAFASRPSRALGSVLERERRAGVDIEVTGDPGILDELPTDARTAMLQAIDQALVNVRKHAGVSSAELSITASGASVVAAVVDDGVGFAESDIPQDRFGFRESIRGALEAVGGTARILSSPGAGTSVLLTVPLGGGE